MRRHPRTPHRYCFDFCGNNLKGIAIATFFYPPQRSWASEFHGARGYARRGSWLPWNRCIGPGISLVRVPCPCPVPDPFLSHTISSFYLQNVYVSVIWIDQTPSPYNPYDYSDVYFYFSQYLSIQIVVSYEIQTSRQSSSKLIVKLHYPLSTAPFLISRTMKSQILYFFHYHSCGSRPLCYQFCWFLYSSFIRERFNYNTLPHLYTHLFMDHSIYLASLDQSTTTTKFSIYHQDGTLVEKELVFHEQISKQENWLEHNPGEIIENVNKAISAVMDRMKLKEDFNARQIVGLGLCNQRETVVCWDAESQDPLYNAIVWCDARTKDVCEKFKQKHGSFVEKTGLPVSTYFTIFKIIWLMENVEGLKQKVDEGKVRFGTIDTWVTLKLTGKYVTDASNASRTHLMDITTGQWDKQLLEIAGITEKCLPQIVDSFHQVGAVLDGPLKDVQLMCILGDQQSSAYAHTLSQTQMKITYGTGCFMLNNIGKHPTFDQSFVTTILSQSEGEREYGFEVAVECGGGTVNWAKAVGLFEQYYQLNHLPERGDDLYFMPSFGTIFSPFWKTDVKGGMIGLNFNTKKEHILKAILDSITFRLFDSIKDPKFKNLTKIIVDGGMTVNQQFIQMQADMFDKEIEVRTLDTCWGVAKGVMKAAKIKQNLKQFQNKVHTPNHEQHEHYLKLYQKWSDTRKTFYGWQ